MTQRNDVIKKYAKEMMQSASISFVISIALLLYYYHLGDTFSWQEINPIEQPPFTARIFYSLFTFSTLGAFLYYVLKFWKGLYFVFGKMTGDYGFYKWVKSIVWLILMGISYEYIVPFTIDVLNAIASFFFNIFNLILYLSPTLGTFICLTILGLYISQKTSIKEKAHNLHRYILQKISEVRGK